MNVGIVGNITVVIDVDETVMNDRAVKNKDDKDQYE